MASSHDPRREHPSTYFVQDRSSQQEQTRVDLQDRMLTEAMGGVLAEQADPERFRSALDVGCGTGNWLIKAAKTYPMLTSLVGIDVSATMIDYARTRAREEGVADRVEFHVMDALRMLEFSDNSFDLVNQRLGISWIRTWDWPKLLQEYQRVCRPMGVIRITEGEIPRGTTPQFTELALLFMKAMYSAGHLEQPTWGPTLERLPARLQRHGIQDLHTQRHELRFPAGTPAGEQFASNNRHGYRTIVPFLSKWTRLPDNYEQRYQQVLQELQRPDFVGQWDLLTVWGTPSGHTPTQRR